MFFIIFTTNSTLLAKKKSIEYKRFLKFQRLEIPLGKKSSVIVIPKNKINAVDLRITKPPKNISTILKNTIKKGIVVKKYLKMQFSKGIIVRIFIVPGQISTFFNKDSETGVFTIDLGIRKNYKIEMGGNSVDVRLSAMSINNYVEKEKVAASLLFQIYNFYNVTNTKLPFISRNMNIEASYPFFKGKSNDVKMINEAVTAFNNKKLKKSEELITKLKKEYKKSPVFSIIPFLKADIQKVRLEKEKEVLPVKYLVLYVKYRNAAAIYPKSPLTPRAYFMMGNIYYKLGMYPEGARDYQVVVERYKNSEYYNLSLLRYAEYLVKTKKYSKAITLLKKMGKPNNKYELAVQKGLFGICYVFENKNKEGFEILKDLIKGMQLQNLNVAFLMTAGELMLLNSKFDDAKKFYEEIVKRKVKSQFHSIAAFRLGDAWLAQGNLKTALKYYERAMNRYAFDEGGRLARLQAEEIGYYSMQSKPPFSTYYKALNQAKTNFEYSTIIMKLALKFLRLKQYENSINLMSLLIEKFPVSMTNPKAKEIARKVIEKDIIQLYRKNKFAVIVNSFEMIPEYMTSVKNLPQVLIYLGKSFNRIAMYKVSAEVFNNLLRINDNESPYIRSAGVLNLIDNYIQDENGEKAKMAIDYYKDIMMADKNSYPVFVRLQGDYYKEIEKNDKKALKFYKKALALEPYAINKLIISSKIAESFFVTGNYKKSLEYGEPLFKQFEHFPESYYFLKQSAVYYLMSLVLLNKFNTFKTKYSKMANYIPDDIKELFDIMLVFDNLKNKKYKTAEQILKSKKFKSLKNIKTVALKLLKTDKSLQKKESKLQKSIQEMNKRIDVFKN